MRQILLNLAAMDISHLLGGLAVVVGLYGYVPYFLGMAQGRIHPHVFSWFIWGLVTAIAFAAQITDNAGAGSWIMIITAMACFGIAACALKIGEKQITRLDWFFFWSALAAIPIWIMTDNPLWAVLLISLIDALAFLPTFRKSWMKPWSESLQTYALAWLKFVLAIAALENVTMVTAFFAATVVATNTIFIVMVHMRRRVIMRPA